MDVIEYAYKASTYVLHHGPQGTGFRRGDEQVHVVGHQYVRVNLATPPVGRLTQASEIKPPIRVAENTGGAIVATLDDMLRNAGQLQSRGTGHASSTRDRAEGCQRSCVIPGKLF